MKPPDFLEIDESHTPIVPAWRVAREIQPKGQRKGLIVFDIRPGRAWVVPPFGHSGWFAAPKVQSKSMQVEV